jgi:hypothetical protein
MSKEVALRMPVATAIGFALAGTCVLAIPLSAAEPAKKKPAEADGGEVRCIYGELRDPHRGFVRCLEPEEVDASWLPPAPQDPDDPPRDPDDEDAGIADKDAGSQDAGGDDAGLPDGAWPEGAVPIDVDVEVGKPKLTAGAVSGLDTMLAKHRDALGRCVGDQGGPTVAQGSAEIQFLFRAPGKAEGVGVNQSTGIAPESLRCIKRVLQNKWVGTPSIEPIGVTVGLLFRASP